MVSVQWWGRDLFVSFPQDSEISAFELQQILNKVISQRKRRLDAFHDTNTFFVTKNLSSPCHFHSYPPSTTHFFLYSSSLLSFPLFPSLCLPVFLPSPFLSLGKNVICFN